MTSTATYVLAFATLFAAIVTIIETSPVAMSYSEDGRSDRVGTASENEDFYHDIFTTISATTSKPELKSLARHIRADPVTSYYDFIINEGSYKFWAVFQVGTAALLIYSAFAAVYYAKYTFATTDYSDYEDDFFFRRSGAAYTPETSSWLSTGSSFLGISPQTFQFIMNAISSKKYS